MKIIAYANGDCSIGMRVAGVKTFNFENNDIEGLKHSFSKTLEDKEIGLILISESLAQNIREKIDNFKMYHDSPLILEVPESTGTSRDKNYLTKFINESVGLKI